MEPDTVRVADRFRGRWADGRLCAPRCGRRCPAGAIRPGRDRSAARRRAGAAARSGCLAGRGPAVRPRGRLDTPRRWADRAVVGAHRRPRDGAARDRRRPGRPLPRARGHARLADRPGRGRGAGDGAPDVLHLFAYTGLATLALARAGAAVAHVDASRPAVAWARGNAARNGLADRPIRWLVDDAGAFVAREVRRAGATTGVVLDPPTYGHGARGTQAWRIETDLGPCWRRPHPLLAAGRVRAADRPHRGPRSGRAATTPCGSPGAPAPTRRTPSRSPSSTCRRRPPGPRVRARPLGSPPMTAREPLTSTANPRVRPPWPARPARARRDRPDARRRRPGAAPGARRPASRSRRRSSCEPLLAGEDARVGARPPRRPADAGPPRHRAGHAKLAFGDRAEGIVAVIRIPDRRAGRSDRARTIRSSSSSRASRSRATSGPSCAAPTAPGRDAVIAASPRTDLANPNAIRASAGTIFALPVAAAPSDGRSSPGCRDHATCASSRRGSSRRPPYTETDLTGPVALVLGAEADGLTDAWRGPDIEAVRLPMHGRRRQPQRLGHRGGAAVRGPAATRPSSKRRRLTTMDGRGRRSTSSSSAPARPARPRRTRRASSGCAVAVIDRRWFGGSCPHIGCLPSKALLHGAAEHRAEPGRYAVAAGVGAPRLHGQPRAGRGRARRRRARPATRGGRGATVYRGEARIARRGVGSSSATTASSTS